MKVLSVIDSGRNVYELLCHYLRILLGKVRKRIITLFFSSKSEILLFTIEDKKSKLLLLTIVIENQQTGMWRALPQLNFSSLLCFRVQKGTIVTFFLFLLFQVTMLQHFAGCLWTDVKRFISGFIGNLWLIQWVIELYSSWCIFAVEL